MRPVVLERLRCPSGLDGAHADAPLVVAVTRRDGDRVLDGEAGCPVCGRTVAIVGGALTALGSPVDTSPVDGAEACEADDVWRLAALLDLRTSDGFVILDDAWHRCAAPLAALTGVEVLAVGGAAAGTGVSVLHGFERPPVADASARGVALTGGRSADAVQAWTRLVKVGGRVVAPAVVPLPRSVRELARDDRHWVGVREPEGVPVSLVRAPSRAEGR